MTTLPLFACPITNSKLPFCAIQERELTYRNDFPKPSPNFVPAKPVTPPSCAVSKLPKLSTTNYESSFQSAYGSPGIGGDRAENVQHNSTYATNFKFERCDRLGPLTTSHRIHFAAKSPIVKYNGCCRRNQNASQLSVNQPEGIPFPHETEYEKAFSKAAPLPDIDDNVEDDESIYLSEYARRTQQLIRDPITGCIA